MDTSEEMKKEGSLAWPGRGLAQVNFTFVFHMDDGKWKKDKYVLLN